MKGALALLIVLRATFSLHGIVAGFSLYAAIPSSRARIRRISPIVVNRRSLTNGYNIRVLSEGSLHALASIQDDDPQPSPPQLGAIRRRSISAIGKDPNAPLLLTVHNTALARKADSIVALDISSLTDIATFMIIIKSNNRLHNRAIAYHIDVS